MTMVAAQPNVRFPGSTVPAMLNSVLDKNCPKERLLHRSMKAECARAVRLLYRFANSISRKVQYDHLRAANASPCSPANFHSRFRNRFSAPAEMLEFDLRILKGRAFNLASAWMAARLESKELCLYDTAYQQLLSDFSNSRLSPCQTCPGNESSWGAADVHIHIHIKLMTSS